jgi:heat shock protein 4
MGEHALSGVTSNYQNTLKGLKRLIGLAYDDPRAQREMNDLPGVRFVPYPHVSGPSSIGVEVQFADQPSTIIPMEAIYGMMIKHMGEIAAEKAKSSSSSEGTTGNMPLEKFMPQDWVIAIPNYFTDSQRRAVIAGCQMVGIQGVQRLMHESTAVSLAYGIFKDLRKEFTKDQPANVMFIDMGASAYTVSIATFEPGKLIVKSAHCDPDLGGRDFDMAIANWINTEFQNKYKGKLSADPMQRPKGRIKLLSAAEKAKKTLSPAGVKEVHIHVEMLQDDYDFSIVLTADTYEKLCEPLLARLDAPVHAALKDAQLQTKDLTAVEIVGGSTRIGCVKRHLQRILGDKLPLSTTMNADEAVARGAALQSAILSPRFKVLPYEIIEAQPYPIRISWENDKATGMEVNEDGSESPTDSVIMFDRGLTFPIVRRVTLRRSGEFVVKAQYDEAATSAILPNREIAEFTIRSPSTTEEKKVRVNVKNDIHGILHLSSAQMVEEIEEETAAPEGGEATEASAGAGGEGTEEGKASSEEKKKKIKKTNLDFTTHRPLDWTTEEMNKVYELEVTMSNTDRVYLETAHMRNELESYIYDMRDKIASESILGMYATAEEKDAFITKNEAMENWLYEEGFDATKSVYAEKLSELKALGGPIEQRALEAQGRASAVSSLQATIDQYRSWVNESQSNEAYAHITDEDRETVRSAVDAISGWMYDMLDRQGGLSPNQDAVLKIADLTAKTQELNSKCGPIMRKPKPKKETPPKDVNGTANGGTSSAADAAGNDGKSTPKPMDVESEDGSKPMETE